MTKDRVKALFAGINIWKRGDARAPHKPLLLLLALARVQYQVQWLPYKDVKDQLGKLLEVFGPPRTTTTIDPFLRLANDGLWQFSTNEGLLFQESALLQNDVAGGFIDEVFSALKSDPDLVRGLAEELLHKHFPHSLHEDILTAVGLNLDFSSSPVREPALSQRAARDANFRHRVLLAYEYSCAVCGFNVRLGNSPVALDAAHIKWHQSGGPDIENNGLALCSMHHRLFDRGAFALRFYDGNYRVKVAQQAHGTSGFEEWLMRYHDQTVRQPQSPAYYPHNIFAQWHWREVFREPSRYSVGQ